MLIQQILEAEQRTAASREIRSLMQSEGYRLLGSGADATVWTKRSATGVIKIIMPDAGQGSSTAKYFEKFYDFCRAHPEFENLPRFSELKKFVINDVEYTAAAMEKLRPVKSGSFAEAMVWVLSDLATTGQSWRQAQGQIQQPQTWQHYSGTLSAQDIVNQFRSMSSLQKSQWSVLYGLMQILYQTGNINRLGWDLHTENVMQRSDGTLVIVDPWFNIESQQ